MGLQQAILRAKYARQTLNAVQDARRIEIVEAEPEETKVEVRVEPQPDIHAIPEEPPPPTYPSIASIIAAVCEHFKVGKTDLVSHRRHKQIVVPRQVAMMLARKLTLHTLPTIGLHMGGRDHSTIISAIQRIERLRKADHELDRQIKELESQLAGSE